MFIETPASNWRVKLVGQNQLSRRKVGSENKDICIYLALVGMGEICQWSLVDSSHRQRQVTVKMTRNLFLSLA